MSSRSDDIAVIGMAGRFPGANSVSEFWSNLLAGKGSIRTLGDEALRRAGVPEEDIADPDYVKVAATIDNVEMFDPAFFKISPVEAELMDPQIRLLLQCAWETLEDAGYARRDAQNVGVFAGAGGVTTGYFANFINLTRRFEKITAGSTHLGNDKDFLSTYISYKLNLTGPSMTVQTACSTSLVALHQARLSLLAGECDMALAGGVTIRVPHEQGYRYREGYIFSKSGRISTFDAAADGVVFGNGLGLVLLKRLDAAIADGDNIQAVIKGSAITNDGRGKMSYAASSAKGQITCVRAAMRDAGVDAADLGFVESHGTGTAMGDPEEVKALSAAFREYTDARGYCALGAVKTNIGHLEAAAGIVGFIKAALAVKHGRIPPTLHYASPNARIRFETTPFYVNSEAVDWKAGREPRRAAVNSLGVGGTNAFVVIEEYRRSAKPSARGAKSRPLPQVVPLSAKTDAALHALASRLAEALREADPRPALADISHTLCVGREHMARRAAFVAADHDALLAALDAFVRHEPLPLPPGREAELAATWQAGEDVDWSVLRGDGKPVRVSLPTYPFALERCWIDEVAEAAPAPAASRLHPLVHANTSDLNEQKYSSSFGGEEFFLKDHVLRISGQASGDARSQRILPGVAYLEMARAAIECAAPIHRDSAIPQLEDVVWLHPIAVASETAVHIALVARAAAGQASQRIDFEVYTSDDRIHCQGRCRHVAAVDAPHHDVDRLSARIADAQWDASRLYEAFGSMGLAYGPAHRPITRLCTGENEVLAQLRLPAPVEGGADAFVLHPSLMDGALQAATALLFDPDSPPVHPIVPFAVERVRIHGACPAEIRVWARHSEGSRAFDKSARLDVDLMNETGRVLVEIRGFMARPLRRTAAGSFLATRTWRADASLPVASAYAGQHVVLCALPQIQPERIARDCELLPCRTDVSVADRYTELARACFAKLKRVFASRPEGRTLVQVALPSTVDTALCAGLAGMFRTARLENPHVSGQLILVDEDISTERLGELLHDERGHPHDSLIRYVGGERQVEHWELLKAEAPSLFEHEGAFRDRGVYLITGGLGGLGRLFAREILARTPTARVVLCGRSTPAEIARSRDTTAALEALRAGGGTVEYRAIDLADADALQAAIAEIVRDHGRIDGILHSAGHIADNYILKKTEEEFLSVLAPKVHGTWHLDQATRDLDLDFFVLFSSLTSAVGNLGQADYAAANGFMDEFAGWRNARVRAGERKGHTLTIRWPLWQNGGMKPEPAEVELLRETTGIYPMRTGTGMRMFYRSLARGLDQTLVMEGDLAAMQRALGHGAMLHASRATPEPETAAPRTSGDSAGNDTAGSDNERIERYLCEILASVLKLPAERIDTRAALENYGIDSILALDLTRALESRFGALPKTLFFEYLTIAELAGYFAKSHAATLERVLAGGGAPAAPVAARDTQGEGEGVTSIRLRGRCRVAEAETAAVREPIAIVGVSGRYPESPDLRAFWRNLRDGRDCIVEVPRERWDWRDYYSEDRSEKGRHFSKWGGFIEGVDAFDARFFNISPVEAENIDPQERLFLEHAWHAVEDAGYTREALRIANANDPEGRDLPAQVGVYAGAMYGEYQLFGAEASLTGERMGFASNPASIANRVSYFLNVHGPSMTVDTMCSSSLTAIHLACQDLHLGRTALGIAGGVNVTIHPNKYLMLSAGQFISGDGHCQSFGEGGDGYIPGEGVGVVVLKRLSDAQRDGDRIHGLIRGTSLSHGGKTNGFTVPNPQAQASAIRQALREAEVDPRHIGYIEAHGTGTKLGDPIEIAALAKVFQESTPDTGFCAIGSVKSNIGHAEAAAGIAGLTKVLLQLRHRQIVPSLHSARLNPHIDFASTPFVVNQTLRPWDAPTIDGRRLPRIAGISSFGAGGSNAHVIVEEAPQTVVVETQGTQLFPVSARNAAQLRQKLEALLAFLEDEEQSGLSPASLAWTLQHGREAMDQRWIARADDLAGLIGLLKEWLANGSARDTWQDDARTHRDAMSVRARDEADATLQRMIDAPLVDVRVLDAVAAQWVRGVRPDWSRLHPRRPALVSLPGYPFARQRFWRDPAAAVRSRGLAAAGIAPLHPLLHENASGLDGIRYRARFAAGDAALDGEGRLSLVASLDMALAAFRHATDATARDDAAGTLELRDLRWSLPQPVVADQALTIHLHDWDGQAVAFELTLGEGDDERVLCQGRAARSALPVRRQAGDSSTTHGMKTALPTQAADAVHTLPMAAFEAALRAIPDDRAAPVIAIDLVRIVFPLQGTGQATIHARGHGHDLELSDAQGTVCVELRGVRTAAVVAAQARAPQPVAASTPPASSVAIDARPADDRSAVVAPQWRPLAFAPVRLDGTAPSSDPAIAPASLPAKIPVKPARIALTPTTVSGMVEEAPVPPKPTGIALRALEHSAGTVASQAGVLPKPTGIVLAVPASLAAPASSNVVPGKPRHALAAPASLAAMAEITTVRASTPVTLSARDDGLLVLHIDAGPGNALDADVLSAVLVALRAAEAVADARLLQIEGRHDTFLAGDADAHALALRHGLYAALLACSLPVAAVVRGDARGAGAVFAACADLLLMADSVRFEIIDAALPAPLSPAPLEPLLSARFGQAEARDLLYLRPRATGADLRARGWRCEVTAPAVLDARLQAITAELLAGAPTSLRLLKAHLARGLVQALDDMDTQSHATSAEIVAPSAMSPSKLLVLQPQDKGVLLARMPEKAGKSARKADALATALRETLAEAKRRGWRCLVLDLTAQSTQNGLLSDLDAAQSQVIAGVLRDAPLPVIVAQPEAVGGHAWWIALHAFAVVHAREGRYTLRAALDAPSLAASIASLLGTAFDADSARAVLLAGGETDGATLHARCPALPVVAANDVLATARSLADAIAALPAASLASTLARRAQTLQATVSLPSTVQAATGPDDASDAWTLQSQVISATRHADGVVEVRMADRDARNMFSEAFSSGMREVFARIADDARCRVVVLTGYDNYFASGGTPETLLSIQQGREVFTDNTVFALPLFCPVPVIAAMQGHGIGAGWALGMYADDALFSSESRYVSPYMGYGFTPGAGATGLIPARIGLDLGRESLLAAREYAGDDLRVRGLRQRVLPRARVVDEAMAQARRIARLPRAWLEAVKAMWATSERAALADVFARELAMHDATFVGDAGTLARIRARFAPTQPTVSAPVAAPQIAAPQAVAQPAAVQASLDPTALVPQLKALLAHELRMDEAEIGENEQFVDLGLDSITGVTWIRRINEAWGTDIEAIRVYSFPTLRLLAAHVAEEAAKAGGASVASQPVLEVQASAPAAPAQVESVASTGLDPASLIPQLKSLLAHELRMEEGEIGENEQFVDLGLDSITGVTWIRRINEAWGTDIEAIRVYSYPTLRLLAAHVAEEAAKAAGVPVVSQPVAEAPVTVPVAVAVVPAAVTAADVVELRSRRGRGAMPSAGRAGPIAIIGMAGRFAKSPDLDAFWRNIAEGRDCIEEVPAERWNIDAYFQAGDVAPGRTYSRWMGVLDDADAFDATFFNISPREARAMDPQQRVFLEACWHAIEHAGLDPKSLGGSRCGVFAGCSAGDYHQRSRREQWSGQGFTGAAPSILAARIAYVLDLHGPNLSIDTACSSSLVAVATACDSLASGGSDLALAGGVNVMSGPAMQVMTAQVGMLSPDGRCFAFDARANGIANGEGVGVVLLKRLADAERDGDRIDAVIEGWGVNQDGRTNGITAPNADSQARLQREVHARFGIDPAGIQLIEAHGTGTPLGDPIEVAGLKASFAGHDVATASCALGSVKSNIGHCLTAAGISGLLKAALALQHRQLPPAANFTRLNPHIALRDTPFYVNERLRPWDVAPGRARRAAVNSFGFSGTNAHVVLAEYDSGAALAAATDGRPELVVLSARSRDRLLAQAQALRDALKAADRLVPALADIAHTLRVGREAMVERLAIVATSVSELVARLDAWIAREGDASRAMPERVRDGRVGGGRGLLPALSADPDFRTIVDKWVARGDMDRLAELWVEGLDLDGAAFVNGAAKPRRVALPGYAFARDRFWLDGASDTEQTTGEGAVVLHPLVQRNVSTLDGQRYRSRFDARRPFAASQSPTAAVCLDMVRVAIGDALPGVLPEGATWRLHDIAWTGHAPVEVVDIALSRDGEGVAFAVLDADGRVHCEGIASPVNAGLVDALQTQGNADPALLARFRDAAQTAPAVAPAARDAIRALWREGDAVGARLSLPEALRTAVDEVRRALLLDAALLIARWSLDDIATAPVALGWIDASGAVPVDAALVAIQRHDAGATLRLADETGRVFLQLDGLSLHTATVVAVTESVMAPVSPAPTIVQASSLQASSVQPQIEAAAAATTAIPLSRIRDELRESLAEALFMRAADIDPQRSFTELGLDSIIGVEWIKAVNKRYGTTLSATRVYDHPSVDALAAHLQAQIAPSPVAPVAQALPVTTATPVEVPAVATASVPALPSLAELERSLRDSLGEALFMAPTDIDPQRSFTELGLDSIIGVEWIKAVNKQHGTTLSATRVYDHPTVRALALHLQAQIAPVAAVVLPSIVPQPVAAPTPIAASAATPVVVASPAKSLAQVREDVRSSLAEALFMRPEDIDPQRSFTELGLDSIIGVEWVKVLNQRHGTTLSATRVYDHPTVEALSAHLHAQLPVVAAPVPAAPMPVALVADTAAPATAAMRAPVAAMVDGRRALRGRDAGGLRFEPKFSQAYRDLYFAVDGLEGDFAAEERISVRCTLAPERNIPLREHVVFGQHLLPTDAWLELVLAAFRTCFSAGEVSLQQIALVAPLIGVPGRTTAVEIEFRRHGSGLLCTVRSGPSEDARVHLQARIETRSAAVRGPLVDAAPFETREQREAAQIATNAGTWYAPLQQIRFGDDRAEGLIRVAEHALQFIAEPFALYGALCTAINHANWRAAREHGGSDDQFLPVRIERFATLAAIAGRDFTARVALREADRDRMRFDIALVDAGGREVAIMEGVLLQRVARATLQASAQSAAQAVLSSPSLPVASTTRTAMDAPVAIVGMACRYPMSPDIDAFWDNLRNGRDCVVEVPESRWGARSGWFHPDPRHADTTYSQWAGLVDDVDAFDPLFFGISPAEAEIIEPQQRVFLEECWKALESAGHAPGSLSGLACGVYVGCAAGDYVRRLGAAGKDALGAAFMGTSTAILAARIAYHLNLKGPALAIDTACSSSLVAVHLACESIRSGENEMALAGGVNLLTTAHGHVLTAQVGMPSRDGRCATFDAGANGIVFSEGCGVVVLKSLAAAQRDNDEILGVIAASGINQDGKTNGITAPSATAQEQLLRTTYARFGIDPARIGYIEAHGTATALGDPIEVDALGAVHGPRTATSRDCVLGSVKSNIGHTGFAAGVAGLIKVLLCLRHRTLVPSLHYATPNPHIDFAASRFRVGTQLTPWQAEGPRMASVSSFGFSGTNAHVVIAEAASAAADTATGVAPDGRVLLPLSARTAESLDAQVRALLAWVETHADALDPVAFARMAWTLQVGRDAMAHRVAVLAASPSELAARLNDALRSDAGVSGLHRGRVAGDDALLAFTEDPEMQGVIERWVETRQLGRLADLWVRGYAVDWRRLHGAHPPRRMAALPTYRFARERCWVDGGDRRVAQAASMLHPLLHRNVSDLSRQAYRSTFGGDEFFLADHRVAGRRVLPAVAYFEIARAALRDASPEAVTNGQAIELRHVAFAQPLFADDEAGLAVEVFEGDDSQFGFEVFGVDDAGGNAPLHCAGSIALVPMPAPERLSLEALRARMPQRHEPAALYARFAAQGLQYGPAFQGIVAAVQGEGECLVELRLPASAQVDGFLRDGSLLNPALLDSALQGAILLLDAATGDAPSVPFAVESLQVLGDCGPRMHAWVRSRAAAGGLRMTDLDLCDEQGDVRLRMRGFSARTLDVPSAFDEDHYRNIIDGVLSRELSADEAVELG
ncbi:MAG TPA: SDR family NAD(P)-dependent oxidoreductase [Xanthomonadaceae bacterium]